MIKDEQKIPSDTLSFGLLDSLNYFVYSNKLIPPLTLVELYEAVDKFIDSVSCDPLYRDWLTVHLNNFLWREVVESTPYRHRLLILPECMKSSKNCTAEHDDFGLVCDSCESCELGTILQEAEDLGMMALVAEGSTMVADLLKSGDVEAVIGVSCLEALEKTFPNMINNAIPGIAIPLSISGCVDTRVNMELLHQAIFLPYKNEANKIGYAKIKHEVNSWFEPDSFGQIIGEKNSVVESLAYDNLTGDGKRWRPFLTTSIFSALNGGFEFPLSIKKLAVSVECFHKASLIHDDIEDRDELRYGKPTLHSKIGLGVALNIGDFLIGEGYRLISESDIAAEQKLQLLEVAASAHRQLTIGQGMELDWMNSPKTMTVDQVSEIFELKTSPAFEVALAFGSIVAGVYDEFKLILKEFSKNLGIAYQIRDDIDDFDTANLLQAPSTVLAFLCEQDKTTNIESIADTLTDDKLKSAIDKSEKFFTDYRDRTFLTLKNVNCRELKMLLFRVAGTILK